MIDQSFDHISKSLGDGGKTDLNFRRKKNHKDSRDTVKKIINLMYWTVSFYAKTNVLNTMHNIARNN